MKNDQLPQYLENELSRVGVRVPYVPKKILDHTAERPPDTPKVILGENGEPPF